MLREKIHQTPTKTGDFVSCPKKSSVLKLAQGYNGSADYGDWGTILNALHDPCCPQNWIPGNPGVPPQVPIFNLFLQIPFHLLRL